MPGRSGTLHGTQSLRPLLGVVHAEDEGIALVTCEFDAHGGLIPPDGDERVAPGSPPGTDLAHSWQSESGGANSPGRGETVGVDLDVADRAQWHVDVADETGDLLEGREAHLQGSVCDRHCCHTRYYSHC